MTDPNPANRISNSQAINCRFKVSFLWVSGGMLLFCAFPGNRLVINGEATS